MAADTSLSPRAKARLERQQRGDLPTASLQCDESVRSLGNWIPVPNPFNLTAPPPEWLRLIHDYDPDLVVFPSRKERVYRLARRARLSGGLPSDMPAHHPDTLIMKQHRLVAVSALPVALVSSPAIIPQLRDRDLWRFGGPEKAIEAIEAMEAAKEAKDEEKMQRRAGEYHREARKTWQYRTGSAKLMARGGAVARGKASLTAAPNLMNSVTLAPNTPAAGPAGSA
jgi:hypothetical protein